MDVISIRDMSKENIEDYLSLAEKMENDLQNDSVKKIDGILSTLFFEPSTRTKLSFQSAAERLGLKVVDFIASLSSLKKGESFSDTVRMIDGYSDVIVVRHKLEGSARRAAEVAEKPVINGGDGGNQHPTQTLLDLYTIKKLKGKIAGNEIHLVGDLKHARTMRSLAYGLAMFGATVKLVAPKGLEMDHEMIEQIKKNFPSAKMEYLKSIDFSNADIAYVCRIQEERFADKYEAMSVKKKFRINSEYLTGVKDNFAIMHPLPKIDEIPPEIDDTKYAKYFEQARNGIPMRMGLIKKVLEG